VDRETVSFLRACEGDGIALRNCPPYIRAWIDREQERHDASVRHGRAVNRLDD
jgi:hypothetical protein